MLKPCCKIIIDSDVTWEFTNVVSVTITADSDTLTDTCVLELPRKTRWEGKEGNPLKRGDAISVWLGYCEYNEVSNANEPFLVERFRGYIKQVGTGTPVVLECEDSMWLLKQTRTTKAAYDKITLKSLIAALVPDSIQTNVHEDIQLGQYRITADTVARELDSLKNYGICTFFKLVNGAPVLFCCMLMPPVYRNKQEFLYAQNIISDSMQYLRKEDIFIQVTAVSILPNNTKIEVKAGDVDGDRRSYYRYNVTEAELNKLALLEVERFKYDGLRGSFETFGAPEMDKGDIAYIETKDSIKGSYLVKKVLVRFDTSRGYKQTIELERKE